MVPRLPDALRGADHARAILLMGLRLPRPAGLLGQGRSVVSEQIAAGLVLTFAVTLALAVLGFVIAAIARAVRKLCGRGLRGRGC